MARSNSLVDACADIGCVPPERLLIGLGGQRCGSSWLHDNLIGHPAIRPPGKLKETHFFDRHWRRGVGWYRDAFAGGTGEVWCESTPYYLYNAHVPWRIAEVADNVRFVVLLRDPATRAVSHYRRYLANGGNGASFAEAAAHQPSLMSFSRYSVALERYFTIFGREAVKVLFYEDIQRRPAVVLAEAARFAGLSTAALPLSRLERRVNSAGVPYRPGLVAAAGQLKRALRRRGYDRAIAVIEALGVGHWLGTAPAAEPMALSGEDTDRLAKLRQEEIEALRALGLDLSVWTGPAQVKKRRLEPA